MKKILIFLMIAMVMITSLGIITVATGNTPTLGELVGEENTDNGEVRVEGPVENAGNAEGESGKSTITNRNKEYMEGLAEAADLTNADIQGASQITSGAKKIAAWIVNIVSYIVIAFLAVRVLLDLLYIVFTPLRSILANGYSGVANANGGNAMAGGVGAQGGFGYGGMNRGMGMANGMGAMSNQNYQDNRGQSRAGNIQLISNQALNAVANESTVGPNGKVKGALGIYAKDMAVVLIVTPILVLLAATGVITRLGFAVGGYIVDAIDSLSKKI